MIILCSCGGAKVEIGYAVADLREKANPAMAPFGLAIDFGPLQRINVAQGPQQP